MTISIELIQQLIIETLIDANKNNKLHESSISLYDNDVNLLKVKDVLNYNYKLYTSNNAKLINMEYQETLDNKSKEDKVERYSLDALWDFCCRGILRPGSLNGNQDNSKNQGYSLTEYGKKWIDEYRETDLLPVSTNKFHQLFEKYREKFGVSYYIRAKEAVSCYLSKNYLACCVMCGAATESIMLEAAFYVENKESVIKKYKASNGRSKIENMLFGQAKSHIKNPAKKYMELLNYWRDETSHGHNSDIDSNEAFIAMLTLVRLVEFIDDNWSEITSKE